MSEQPIQETQPVLQIQNTKSAFDVVYAGVTIDQQVPSHLIETGVSLDSVLFLDKKASKLAEVIAKSRGHIAFAGQLIHEADGLNIEWKTNRISLTTKPYAEGDVKLLKTHPGIDGGTIELVLLHPGAAYKRGNSMSDQMDYVRELGGVVQDLESQGIQVRWVTGRSYAQMQQAPYAPKEIHPASRMDEGFMRGFCMDTSTSGNISPHYFEDGAVLGYNDGKTELNLPSGVDGELMQNLIARIENTLPHLNARFAQYTDSGNDPFYMPAGKLTRVTVNLPKSLRDSPDRTDAEKAIIDQVQAYAEINKVNVADKRTYHVK